MALVLRVMHFAPDIGRVKEHMPVALTLQELGVAVLGALCVLHTPLFCARPPPPANALHAFFPILKQRRLVVLPHL